MMDNQTSYFVEAGAGSGKTTQLVERMVSMVESGIDVSEICAITFTKAAAAEFYSRFQKRLIERSLDNIDPKDAQGIGVLDDPTEETKALCQKALENIDLCFMGTIDSFCNMLVREHPAEARVPSDAHIINDAEQMVLIKREYKTIQRGAYGTEAQQLNRRFTAIVNANNIEDEFAFVTQTLMKKRDTEFILPPVPADLSSIISKGTKDNICALVDAAYQHRYAKFDVTQNAEKAWNSVEKNAETVLSPRSQWNEKNLMNVKYALSGVEEIAFVDGFDILKLGPVVSGMFESYTYKKQTRYRLKKEVKDQIKAVLDLLDDYHFAIAINLAAQCVPQIAATLCREGLLTYFDYKLYVRDMLKRDAAAGGTLIKHISQRHKYFLLDELQDTDPMQFEIFFYLAAKDPVADWRKCIPRPGSLFAVGDPKQSIYRFKGANIASYLDVKKRFDSDEAQVLPLQDNHRSNRELKEWFNETFSDILPENTEDQSRFYEIPIDPMKKDASSSIKGIYKYISQGDGPAEIANIIGHLVERDDISYKDIMLITFFKPEITGYAQKFYEKKIPFKVEGDLVFGDCPALVLASKVYKAIALPYDTRWFYGALLSGLFDVTEQKLLDLRNNEIRIRIGEEIPEDKSDAGVRDAFATLRSDYLASFDLTPSALLGKVIEEYDLFATAGTDNLEYLYYAMELLRAEESSGALGSLADGAVFLDNLLDGGSDTERCLSFTKASDSDCVHVANLHKVKGLEQSIVILAPGTKQNKSPGERSEYTEKSAQSWFFQFKRRGENYPYCQTNQFEDEQEAEKASAEAEYLRLLYVAATRAANALIIGGVQNKDGKLLPSNYWKLLLDHCETDLYSVIPSEDASLPETNEITIAKLYKNSDSIDLSEHKKIAKKTYHKECPSTLPRIKTKPKKDDPSAPDAPDTPNDDPSGTDGGKKVFKGDPRVIGNMVHTFMEAMVSSKGEADPAALIRELIDSFSDDLTPGVDYPGLLSAVADKILSGGYPKQENGVPVDVLSELLTADEVYCELPFCYMEDAAGTNATPTLWNGVIDVAYKKAGKWHILDYKTNYETDHLGDTYQNQLNQYVRAFKAIEGVDADAHIYSIPV